MVLLEKVIYSFIKKCIECPSNGRVYKGTVGDVKKNRMLSQPLRSLGSCRKYKVFSQMRITPGEKHRACHRPLGVRNATQAHFRVQVGRA